MVAVDPQVEAVLSRITREDLLELALALGNIESPTGYEGPACDYVYDWMQREGFQPERVGAFEDRYNVVGRLPGTGGGPSLAFNSHLDTIIARTDTLMYLNAEDPVYHSAWYELSQGRVERAGEFARTAVSLADQAGARFPAAVMRNDLGRVLFYLGDKPGFVQKSFSLTLISVTKWMPLCSNE